MATKGGARDSDIARQMEGLHIGSEFNQWKRPNEIKLAVTDSSWMQKLRSSQYIGEVDFGRKEWDRACKAVDAVTRKLRGALITKAESKYKGLKIDSYILQGSARDGLKVIAPDEFDLGFEYHIEGIHLEDVPILKNGRATHGLCYLKVLDSLSTVQKKSPDLWKKGVFIEDESNGLFLSSKLLHQKVFVSLIDQAYQEVEKEITKDSTFDFKITRKMNPPAINISIHLDDGAYGAFKTDPNMRRQPANLVKKIDVDIIPAMRIKVDEDTASRDLGRKVNAPIHAICKWKEDVCSKALQFADQRKIWLLNSVAYERFIYDAARYNPKQEYILTALRILKTYMTKVKTRTNPPPPQIATVLQSYHLKQITCYLILYTCYVHRDIDIDCVRTALILLVDLLETSLKGGKLPHFFYSNSRIGEMFENFPQEKKGGLPPLRLDMFRQISDDAKRQALLSLSKDLKPDLDIASPLPPNISNAPSRIQSAFNSEVANGDFF